VREYAEGRSFCDVGAMWGVNGRISFVAEEAGASRVTAVDIADPTPEYEREHERRRSKVRFVGADLHDSEAREKIGRHDVVFCSGVLYHSPSPILALSRLRELTGERLILQSACIPELPGVAHGLVFLPGLPDSDRALYGIWGPEAAKRIGRVPAGVDEYGPWWWGLTRSAVRAMAETTGFAVDDEISGSEFSLTLLARPR
jgi:hypothetical protein